MANTAFGAAFDKALRAYQTGGITHSDFLSEIDTQMEGGASVSEMLDVLWRREQIEALPPPIHAVVLARIEQPLRQTIPEAGPDADRDVPPAALAADEFVFSWDSDPFAVPAEEQQQYLAGTVEAAVQPALAPEPVEPPKAAAPPKVVEPPKPVETPKVLEPPKAAAPPKVVEPPKPIEAPKVLEPPKAAAPPKVVELPKPVEPPRVPEPPQAAAPPKAVAPPKPVETPKAADLPPAAAPPQLAEPPKSVETAKPAQTPKAADAPEPAQVPKTDDGPNRLGRAIARELRDWLSPERPKLPDAAPSALSELPKEKVKDAVAKPAVTPPVSEPPRFSKLRPEPRPVVPDTLGAASLAKRIFADAPHVTSPPPQVPRKDPPRVDASPVKRPVFDPPRVATTRPEPRTVVIDPRSLPPIAPPRRTESPPGAPPPFETPRVSTSRPEPRTVVIGPRSTPPVVAPPRANPPRADAPRADAPRADAPLAAAPSAKPPVFETPRVSTSRPEPRTVVLDPRIVSPTAVPPSAPSVSGPSLTAAGVDVSAFETPRMSPSHTPQRPALEPLRVSTARSEAPTVVLGDRLSTPLDEQKTTSVDEFFGGRFRLIEQVADSDMSRVYRAEDVMVPKTERQVIALKVFKRSVASNAPAVAAMQSEFARVHALSHPNLVQLIECGTSDGTPFVTMEWLTGMSLYRRLDALAARHEPRGLPAREARNVINSVAAALEYAHARGVVHGDLKPGNIFLCSDGSVKLIDFGLSIWFAHGPMSAAAPVIATPRYASPQVMARQGVTQADDVYAFACVVYEIMSGHYPFAGVGGVEDARFVPLKQPSFNNAQYAALLNGLAQDTAQRAPSVHAFMQQFANDDGARRIAFAKWAALALVIVGGAWLLHASGFWQAMAARLEGSPVRPAPISNTSAQATFRDCRTCPQMVVVPAGQFEQDLPGGGGRHTIVFEHPFAMAVSPVTVGEYQAFVTATRRDERGCEVYDGTWRRRLVASFKDPGFPQTADHPVTCVSWTDAVAYAEWLSQTTGHPYNLPSAAQWEYSARAGSTGATPWDADGNACAVANVADHSAAERYKGWNVFACSDNFLYTSPVNAFPANSFGLHDMLGNVLEWTLDCWQPAAAAAPADGSARGGKDCRQHEVRGASWFSSPTAARIARREHFAASLRISTTGLRVVRQVDR